MKQMFEFITHPILRNLIESRIKSAFADEDVNKTRLRQWLAVANGGRFSKDTWNYQFKKGKSLVDFGLARSDELLTKARANPSWYKKILFGENYGADYRHESQAYYKNTIESWMESKKEYTGEVELSWYHRFFNWCISKCGLQWAFNSADFNDDALFLKLREHEGIKGEVREPRIFSMANKPSQVEAIREKYSVAKLLSSPDIILKRMQGSVRANANNNDVPQAPALPSHMSAWSTGLVLNQAVEEAHQHIAQQEQNVNAVVEITDLQRINDAIKWTDDSVLNTLKKAKENLRAMNYQASIVWIKSLDHACKSEWRKSPVNTAENVYFKGKEYDLSISDNALKMLLQAKGHVRSRYYALDLNLLPLGFFIDKNDEGYVFILKYNDQYRLYQLATLPDAAVRLDVKKTVSDFQLSQQDLTCFVTKEDLLDSIKERHLHLEQRQLDFLEHLNRDTHAVQFVEEAGKDSPYIKTSAYAFRALKLMVEAIYPLNSNEKQDPYLSEFIDILDLFSKISLKGWTRYSRYSGNETESINFYLNQFILNYLRGMTNGKEFYEPEERVALRRFAEFNRHEFLWLDRIESASRKYNLSFSETAKGLFYFFDYFNALGMPVPKCSDTLRGASYLGGFIELKDILDCISLAGNGKNILAKQFQAKYAASISSNFKVAKAALRSGYAFVHEAMLFGFGDSFVYAKFDYETFNTHIVSRDEFEQLRYGSNKMAGLEDPIYFRAMYLRFISYHVEPQYFDEAVEQWVTITNTDLTAFSGTYINNISSVFDILDSALKSRWHELQQYALSLPSIMATNQYVSVDDANEVAEAFANQQESPYQARYSQEHLDYLIKEITLPLELESEIRESIRKIDGLTRIYSKMPQDVLQKALKSIKEKSLEERIALLRETHCRLTCSKSKANLPQGEWLRLEQLVAILIAMKKDSLLQIDTGEGKTFILQMIGLLKALDAEKVNVLTHNESLAFDAADKIKKLAHLLGIKTAKKTDSALAIMNADILYIDISTAVINDLLAKQSTDETNLPGKRQASTAIIDEVDNIVIDIYANTTMQISKGREEADENLEQFLTALNDLVRHELPLRPDLADIEAQRHFIREHLNQVLKANSFYITHCIKEDGLDKYIRAAIAAMQLKRNQDYVIEEDNLVINECIIPRKAVHIMHKDTTGRADKLSQWGEGVHQFVAAYEKQQNNPTVIVPGISEVLAEGNIADYLGENYRSRIGVTATVGNTKVRDKIAEIIKTDLNTVIPRAMRKLTKEAAWPLKEGKPVYSRAYRFPPIYKESKAAQFAILLEAIRNIQDNNQSCIIFWNTISECDNFFAYLKEQKIHTSTIQILDDTHDDEKTAQNHVFRPSEATVIARAKESKMITLTTAAGSRGTDFDDINVGILTKPNLGRVTIQKVGRIARNTQFGLIYEIYNMADLDLSLISKLSFFPDTKDPMTHRQFILAHETAKEELALKTIEQRQSKSAPVV